MEDSLVHPLDVGLLRAVESLTLRAVGEQRPIVLLKRPLQFSVPAAQDATPALPVVRLEGLYLAPDNGFPPGAALITRAAVARLEIVSCTLAPGGHRLRNGMRAAMTPALRLSNDYGFATQAEVDAFVPTPDIVLQRCVTGALGVDDRYRIDIQDSIVDAGLGVGPAPLTAYAIGAAASPDSRWGAPLSFSGVTCFGMVRVSEAAGMGGVFTQAVEVLDNQHGCIKWSAFPGTGNRLPPNHFCLQGAALRFTSEWFNDPGYAQLAFDTDARIRTLGPDDDAMGAFGFLLEAHKWINLQVRLREFTPVGVRPLVVPVT